MKFKHLAEAQVAPGATSRFHFPDIDGFPWLEVRPAGETNKPYMNAAMRRVDRQSILRGKLTAEESARERQESIPLYAEHILTGACGGWIDEETGAEVPSPLSMEARIALLKQLPSDLYDGLRRHCNDLSAFRVGASD